MMDPKEISALMKSVGGIVREYVSAALVSVSTRLDELDARIKAIPAGSKGDKGDPGRDGESIIGPKGDTGERGEQGFTVVGPIGPQGDPGKDGDSIVGPVGPQGEKGLDGKNAEPIHPDTIVLTVLTEVQKAVAAIPKAKDGKDGEPGRDALQIEILPMIDPQKSYARGTFALHSGGTMRARVNTTTGDSVNAGEWEVTQNGIAGFEFTTGEDPRVVSVECLLTDGLLQKHNFRIPFPLFKNVFREGEEYIKGDVVQYGGSMWMVRADSTKARPGENPDWQLVVKSVRGKDGTNGTNGERGPEGPRGKDLTQVDFNGRKH